MPAATPDTLIAVDIGNSQIKLGRFDFAAACEAEARGRPLPIAAPHLPEPTDTLQLPLDSHYGTFDAARLFAWCDELLIGSAYWVVGSVHAAAADEVRVALEALDPDLSRHPMLLLDSDHIPLSISVATPSAVGIDRLAAALAAERLRDAGRPVLIVDHGSAITVDLLTAKGEFAGGAILPGTAMGGRALAEQTDALPYEHPEFGPADIPLVGTDTRAAIRAGLYWGTIGAVRELAHRMADQLEQPPQIFVTGGGAGTIVDKLADDQLRELRHVPHLVLAGVALAGRLARRAP